MTDSSATHALLQCVVDGLDDPTEVADELSDGFELLALVGAVRRLDLAFSQ